MIDSAVEMPAVSVGEGKSNVPTLSVDHDTKVSEEVTSLLSQFNQIYSTSEPVQWWRRSYRLVRTIQKHQEQYSPEVQHFINSYVGEIIGVLEDEVRNPEQPKEATSDDIAKRALTVTHEVADVINKVEDEKGEMMPTHTLSLEELVSTSDRMQLKKEGDRDFLQVYSRVRDEWFDFPLPNTDTMIHKGGFPRVALKLLAVAPESMIEAELPPNDYDVISWGDHEAAYREADEIGVDVQGVETVEECDYSYFCKTRDVDLNGCFIGRDGLTYSDEAFEAARTGRITVKSMNRGIYGSEKFRYQDVELIKSRGMMRLIKMVTEGKALSFDLKPLNKQVDLGIYWLVLARKFSKKENFPELMDRFFYLGKQLDQVRPEEKTVFDVLDRVHAEHPFFDFDRGQLDQVGVARWLNEKLLKYTHSTFRQRYRLSGNFQLERSPFDNVPTPISLRHYTPSPLTKEGMEDEWNAYLQRCRERKQEESYAIA